MAKTRAHDEDDMSLELTSAQEPADPSAYNTPHVRDTRPPVSFGGHGHSNKASTNSAQKLSRMLGNQMQVMEIQPVKTTWTTFVMQPEGRTRVWLDWATIVVVLFSMVYAPWNLALAPRASSEFRDMLVPVDALMDVILWFDILCNFRTVYLEESDVAGHQKRVSDPMKIAIKYVKGYFLLDLLACFPFELCLGGTYGESANGSVLGTPFAFLPLLKVARLLRKGRVRRRVEEISLSPRASRIRLVTLLVFFVTFAHYFACLFIVIGVTEDSSNEDSWLSYYELGDYGASRLYMTSFYWALTTMVTVGYGDISPQTWKERLFACFVFFISAVLYASVFSNVTLLLAKLDKHMNRYHDTLDEVEEFIKLYDVPAKLQTRIRKHCTHVWRMTKGFDGEAVISDLPESLRADIKLALLGGLVDRVPLFQGSSPQFIKTICLGLKQKFCLRGEYVFEQGDLSEEMYILRSGRLTVLINNVAMAELREGAFFGEIALVTRQPRTASIRASTACEYFSLSVDDFNVVLKQYPEHRDVILDVAVRRMRRNHDETVESLLANLREEKDHPTDRIEALEDKVDDMRDTLMTRLDTLERLITAAHPGPVPAPAAAPAPAAHRPSAAARRSMARISRLSLSVPEEPVRGRQRSSTLCAELVFHDHLDEEVEASDTSL